MPTWLLTHGINYRGLNSGFGIKLVLSKSCDQRERKKDRTLDVIMIKLYNFYYILFIRNKSPCSTYTA